MRKRNLLSQNTLLILFLLFVLISIPKQYADRCRGSFAAVLRPSWSILATVNQSISHPLAQRVSHPTGEIKKGKMLLKDRLDHLRLENELLKQELENSKIRNSDSTPSNPYAIPAKIIYRPPSTWNETFWIDIGDNDNQKLKEKVIVKNSPVLIGSSLIGIIDYVGKKQSRVKLMTGSTLLPAVRAVRGKMQNLEILEQIDSLLTSIEVRDDLFKEEDKLRIEEVFGKFREELIKQPETLFLAKGELQGSENPLWRKNSSILKGVGFNYEFSDEKGPARDLRSGKAIGVKGISPVSILEEGDLLVTSGLDGVFPEGISVATVTEVKPLQEGSYYYEIKAKITAKSIDTASHVIVIAPQEVADYEL